MIWRSALNIFWAMVRNFLQGKHQCTTLDWERDRGWGWDCSCGGTDSYNATELGAIKSFSRHVKHPQYKTWGSRMKERV